MLEWIDIKDFAIVKHIELDFSAGLSIISGETGAGKSILINALSAVLGNRVDTQVVRHGAKQAEIQARFELPKQHQALQWLATRALEEDGQCIIRRIIPADKSSKAFINGRAVSAAALRDLGGLLVDIHGQHEHQSLLKAQTQQSLLDNYGGCSALLGEVNTAFKALKTAQLQLDKLIEQEQDLRDRLALVNFQLQELDGFAPQSGEWLSLEAEHKRLHHQAEISQAVQSAIDHLSGSQFATGGATATLSHARGQLNAILAYAPEAEHIISTILEAETMLDEAVGGLKNLHAHAEIDPQALTAIEARFSSYHTLARKYQTTPEQLFASYQNLQVTQQSMNNPEAEKSALVQSIKTHRGSYLKWADKLTLQRSHAAEKLAQGVSDSMQQLGMKGGSFFIELAPNSDALGSALGNEAVNFRVASNPGFPAQNLSRVASGGELSRISLAIQVLLAENKTISSMVFDEVDVGIGGKTAAIVGKLLEQLAKHCQILCITHLPQVAARGQNHYQVMKGNDGGKATQAQIQALNAHQRTEEIARMVGGEMLTDESMAHAKSLLGQG